jgi:flagellar biosynthesis protein FlgN
LIHTPGRDDPASLPLLIGRELDVFRAFHQILEIEQAALLEGDVERLLPLAPKKNDMVAELARLGETRNALLRSATGATNQLGMTAWLATFDPENRLGVGTQWQALLDLARRAKGLNETNGQVINSRLASNEQALEILMGANTTTSRLYGRDGQAYSSAPGSGSRPLGKA